MPKSVPYFQLVAVGTFLLASGCKDNQTPATPTALEVTQAPANLEEAFAKAPAEARGEALEAAGLLKGEDYVMALVVLQKLCARPELTGDQRTLAARSMLTAQQEVAKAAELGDEESKRLLKYRSMNK